MLSGGGAYVFNSWLNAKKISALNLKNSKLEKQLKITRDKIVALGEKTDLLARSNGELRAYAHLPLLDGDVLKMGIGGALPAEAAVNTGAENLLTYLDQIERTVDLQQNSLTEINARLQDQEDLLKSIPSIRPVNGGAYSTYFGGRRDPFNGRMVAHSGLDINTYSGAPVYSSADGVVIHAEREPGYGNIIIVDHGHGYRTWYAHLSRFYVSRGAKVTRGEAIGAVGSTGRSTGPHLHYQVMRNNQPVDPLDYMFEGFAVARLP
jgi:murein DD-endopeptidase MepM/ murein hydrolase activator NlpD